MLAAFIGTIIALAFGISGTSRTEPGLIVFGIFLIPVILALHAGTMYLAYGLATLMGNPMYMTPMLFVAIIIVYALLCVPPQIALYLEKKRGA